MISAGKRDARKGSWAIFGSVELKKIAEDLFFFCFCIIINFYFVLQKVRVLHIFKKMIIMRISHIKYAFKTKWANRRLKNISRVCTFLFLVREVRAAEHHG